MYLSSPGLTYAIFFERLKVLNDWPLSTEIRVEAVYVFSPSLKWRVN